jgi:hypothetical protein
MVIFALLLPDVTMNKLLWVATRVMGCAFMLLHTGCNRDEGIATIQFLNSTGIVTEGFTHTVYYNRSLPQGAQVEVSFEGTLQTDEFTYELIPAGVKLTIIDDEVYDPSDTLIITLTGITGPAQLGDRRTVTLRVKDYDEDARPGLFVALTWNAGNGTAGDVDMDLFVWRENPEGSGNFELVASAVQIGNSFEAITLRNGSAVFPDGLYGVSYTYYSGTANPLNFSATFRAQKGTLNNDSIVGRFSGTYTLANINKWDQTDTYHIAQTFRKTGNNFHDFSPLDIPASGSRVRSYTFTPIKLKKGH